MLQVCPVCKETIETDKKPGIPCKSCHAERSRQFRLNNPEKAKISDRKQDLKKRYGITEGEYNAMFNEQLGHCAGCGVHASQLRRNLCVDHSRITGQIRGLLCDNCNLALGHLKDNPTTLLQLIKYLEASNAELADYSNVVNLKSLKKSST